MNVMRQFFAIAILFSGSYFLEKKKPLLFFSFLFLAVCMHTSAIIGLVLFFIYFWNINYEKKIFYRLIMILVFFPIMYVAFSRIKDAYELYVRYFDVSRQNVGFMLVYKFVGMGLVCYISKFGLVRDGNKITGLNQSHFEIAILYALGLLLCSLGMFFPYVDRVGLYFLMFEMPFWGWAVKSHDMKLLYKLYIYLFIVYLYIMNLFLDGQKIFPYSTIWS